MGKSYKEQRKWEVKQSRAGLCPKCGEPMAIEETMIYDGKVLCETCYMTHRSKNDENIY